jgi:hypothetical protein
MISQKELDALLKTVEQICLGMFVAFNTGEAITSNNNEQIRRYGAQTPQIRGVIGLSEMQTSYRLKKLKNDGRLISLKTSWGTVQWWPVGLSEKLFKENHK